MCNKPIINYYFIFSIWDYFLFCQKVSKICLMPINELINYSTLFNKLMKIKNNNENNLMNLFKTKIKWLYANRLYE